MVGVSNGNVLTPGDHRRHLNKRAQMRGVLPSSREVADRQREAHIMMSTIFLLCGMFFVIGH